MCNMVKLHDLVDLTEPPWRRMANTPYAHRHREEDMDLDDAMEN